AFYTVDKVSFISGGFNPIFAWKNYPVCPDCALALHAGARYVENCLRFTFTGYNYFLLPKLLNFNDNQMRDLLKKLKNYESFWLDESKKSRIQRTENFIFRKLSNWENIVNFNFLMYKKTNAEFNIILFLQEIPPTRLKKIIKTQDNINQNYSFLLSVLNNVKYEENLFYVLKGFFIGDKEDLDFQKAYLSIIRGIFYLKPINLELLLNRFMAKIRREMYKKSKLPAKVSVINGLRIILFFKELNILTKRRNYMQDIRGPYNEYFERYPIFEDAVQKALFLEGVLAGRLLNIQYNNRGSEPFFDRLNGLKIDEKIAKRVLPEMINKLEEYNENKKYLKEIESAISSYFMNSNFCSYSIDELSFYFSLGLTQYHDFLQFILNSEKEDNNKEDMNE
ncbi:MAG: TIGR02556 family CRISPR-associated protein, partial [Candidatus Helarchaeota archaeon]